MARFDGKIIVVTGAGQGIGEATAKAFVKEGAKVILTGRTLSKLERVVGEINSENAVAFHMDVGVEEDWIRLIDFIKEKYGEIDYLINNAAIVPGYDIFNIDFATFQEVIKCNVYSVFLGMKYGYEVLKKGVYSTIVNVSSVGSKRTGPNGANDAAYVTSKGGINMLSKHAAVAYAKDCIRVNSILPGSVNGPMREAYIKQHPEVLDGMSKTKPLPPHCTEAEHTAFAILFACDPACAGMTGAEIVVDAGSLLV